MLTPGDLSGLMAMMPAFATPDAADVNATDTVAVDNLHAAVRRIIADGVDVIATSGSFGEFHTLLWEEWQTLARAALEAVDRRVPLFIGCTALNTREVVRRMRFAREAGAEGVLLGIPFYFPSTVDNAVRFYEDVADLFPDLAIMVYHNPTLFKTSLPPRAFSRLLEHRNIVAMKDSHRDTRQFLKLMDVTDGRLSVFVNTQQAYPYVQMGAAGFWSYDVWMGPWPALALRDAVRREDVALARKIILDLGRGPEPDATRQWLETAAKLAIANADYCVPGPLRPPFVVIPEDVRARAEAQAAHWHRLVAAYRPAAAADGRARGA